jgi:hypothetical protein
MKKIMFVLFLIFIVRLFVSCCRCSDETTPMQLNEITIKNLCTAGDYGDVICNETDAMSSSKVAFILTLNIMHVITQTGVLVQLLQLPATAINFLNPNNKL